jgi:hypothetical protein
MKIKMILHAATHYYRFWWPMVAGALVMITILVTNEWVADLLALKEISH